MDTFDKIMARTFTAFMVAWVALIHVFATIATFALPNDGGWTTAGVAVSIMGLWTALGFFVYAWLMSSRNNRLVQARFDEVLAELRDLQRDCQRDTDSCPKSDTPR